MIAEIWIDGKKIKFELAYLILKEGQESIHIRIDNFGAPIACLMEDGCQVNEKTMDMNEVKNMINL